MAELVKSTMLLFMLLNPFLLVIYLIDVLQKLDRKRFSLVLVRAGIIASTIFFCFAILGDAVFSKVMQAHFASFQIFGGVVFLLIGIQFVFRGPKTIEMLRGESEHLAGAIAMPVLIGPGTISASIIVGERHPPLLACAAILTALVCSIATVLVLKLTHDFFRPKRERLIERYIEIAGRITAFFVGTISIEMIMEGLRTWIGTF